MAGQPLGGGGDKENQEAVTWVWGLANPYPLTPSPEPLFIN
jgi:hypothetical protein